jgi:hypothetical protein
MPKLTRRDSPNILHHIAFRPLPSGSVSRVWIVLSAEASIARTTSLSRISNTVIRMELPTTICSCSLRVKTSILISPPCFGFDSRSQAVSQHYPNRFSGRDRCEEPACDRLVGRSRRSPLRPATCGLTCAQETRCVCWYGSKSIAAPNRPLDSHGSIEFDPTSIWAEQSVIRDRASMVDGVWRSDAHRKGSIVRWLSR